MKYFIIISLFIFSISGFSAEEKAYLAGGCFWCVESDLEKIPGVISITSGYSGGTIENPTYAQVKSGATGHRESVLVIYDNSKLSYEILIYNFLKKINPTDNQGQFIDRGFQYSPGIFYLDKTQYNTAKKQLDKIKKEGNFKEVNVPLVPFKNFYPAEEYHQDYYKKNSIRYKYYRHRSGRDQFLEQTWKKINK